METNKMKKAGLLEGKRLDVVNDNIGILNKFLAILALMAVVTFAFYIWISMPVVYESFTTGQCMEVYDPSGQHSCENLPERYIHEWRQ